MRWMGYIITILFAVLLWTSEGFFWVLELEVLSFGCSVALCSECWGDD